MSETALRASAILSVISPKQGRRIAPSRQEIERALTQLNALSCDDAYDEFVMRHVMHTVQHLRP